MKLNGYKGTIAAREGMLYANGVTEYRIVLPEKASECERFAGEELRDLFAEAGVPIEIATDAGMTPDPSRKVIALGNTVYFPSDNIDSGMMLKCFRNSFRKRFAIYSKRVSCRNTGLVCPTHDQ